MRVCRRYTHKISKRKNKEKRNKNEKMKMTKHNIYIGVNCTQSDQPKPHSNSSISLYTSIICISGHIFPKNDIQTSAFHPTTHDNNEFILVPGVQVYHHPKILANQNQTPSHFTDTSYLFEWLAWKASFPSSNIASKGSTQ